MRHPSHIAKTIDYQLALTNSTNRNEKPEWHHASLGPDILAPETLSEKGKVSDGFREDRPGNGIYSFMEQRRRESRKTEMGRQQDSTA